MSIGADRAQHAGHGRGGWGQQSGGSARGGRRADGFGGNDGAAEPGRELSWDDVPAQQGGSWGTAAGQHASEFSAAGADSWAGDHAGSMGGGASQHSPHWGSQDATEVNSWSQEAPEQDSWSGGQAAEWQSGDAAAETAGGHAGTGQVVNGGEPAAEDDWPAQQPGSWQVKVEDLEEDGEREEDVSEESEGSEEEEGEEDGGPHEHWAASLHQQVIPRVCQHREHGQATACANLCMPCICPAVTSARRRLWLTEHLQKH